VRHRSTSVANPSRTYQVEFKMAPEAPVRLQSGKFVVRLPRMLESACRAVSQRECPAVFKDRGSHTLLRGHEILQILVVHLLYQGEPVFQWNCAKFVYNSSELIYGSAWHGHLDVSEILNHG